MVWRQCNVFCYIACIAIFNYSRIWLYSLGHTFCTIDISLPKAWVLAHFGDLKEHKYYLLFEFHKGNQYVWIPFLEKVKFSNRQNIHKDIFG